MQDPQYAASLYLPIFILCLLILIGVGIIFYFLRWEAKSETSGSPVEIAEDPIAEGLSFGGSWAEVVEDRAWL